MYITLISIFISISADPTTISLLHLPIATLCAIALLYTRYKIRKQEKDDDAARNLETVKALASIAETVKDSAATKELADLEKEDSSRLQTIVALQKGPIPFVLSPSRVVCPAKMGLRAPAPVARKFTVWLFFRPYGQHQIFSPGRSCLHHLSTRQSSRYPE